MFWDLHVWHIHSGSSFRMAPWTTGYGRRLDVLDMAGVLFACLFDVRNAGRDADQSFRLTPFLVLLFGASAVRARVRI